MNRYVNFVKVNLTKYSNNTDNVIMLVFISILFIIKFFAKKPVFTGDEPRYLHMAYSFIKTFSFDIPYNKWVAFCNDYNLYVIPPEEIVRVHAPFSSILISPFVGIFGPEGGRWSVFIVAIIGFIFLKKLLDDLVSPLSSLLITFFIFTTLPAFSYTNLLYTDIWLMIFFSIAIFLTTRKNISLKNIFWGLTLSLILPFFHIRMALVSFILVMYQISRIFIEYKDRYYRTLICSTLYCLLFFIGFICFEFSWTGSLFGSANAPFKPGFFMFFERLSIQLFTIRHGLFIYNPVLLLALVGLIIGIAKKNNLAQLSSIILLFYTVSFVWGAASESYPARFWVAILPVFGVGISIWIRYLKFFTEKSITAVFVIVAYTNSVLYFFSPNLFLSNRQVSYTYEALYTIFPFLNFSTFIPWDKYFFIILGIDSFFHESRYLLLCWSLITIAILISLLTIVLSIYNPLKVIAKFVIYIIFISVLVISYMVKVPSSEIVAKGTVQEGNTIIDINFTKPIRASVVKLINQDVIWSPPYYPKEYLISTSQDGIIFHEIGKVRAAPFIRLPFLSSIRALKITALNFSNNKWINDCRISVLENNFKFYSDSYTYEPCLLEPSTLPKEHSIEIGEIKYTKDGGDGLKYLFGGWSHPEPWGTWSDGYSSMIAFIPPVVIQSIDLTLEIESVAFLAENHPFQEIDVYLKNNYLTTLNYTLSNNHSIRSIQIPYTLIVNEPSVVLVNFKYKNSKSPKELDLSADNRRLGLGIISIQLKQKL
ncbi:MAG: hypothetical protein HQK77_12375 [Desulfobacterales bacterium]|nr:hypothetical protein [Desulfobacterales bacterium]